MTVHLDDIPKDWAWRGPGWITMSRRNPKRIVWGILVWAGVALRLEDEYCDNFAGKGRVAYAIYDSGRVEPLGRSRNKDGTLRQTQ